MANNFLKFFFALFAILTLGVGNAWGAEATINFSEKGLENGVQYLDPFTIDANTTITFAGGGNDGKYYNTGTGIRTYANGTITVECTNGTISEISFTWGGTDYKPTADVATLAGYSKSTGKWTGSTSSVTLTRPSGNGHWRLQKVTVTYETAGGSVTPDPEPNDPETPGIGGDATMTAGTNGSACTVNGEDGIKVGTSKLGGDMQITVPAGAIMLHVYAAAWNDGSGLSLNITPTSNVTKTSIALTADAGIKGNPPFTLSGDEADYLFDIPLQNITAETTLTFTSSTTKRFVVWGATYETASGNEPGTEEPVLSVSPENITWTGIAASAEKSEEITVTLSNIEAVMAELSGDASAFSIDKDFLEASGKIIVSKNTTTIGTYAANLIITDTDTQTKTIALSMEVVADPEPDPDPTPDPEPEPDPTPDPGTGGTGTINFNSNAVKINAASVTGDDNLGNTWTITTVGTTSFTSNSAYYQVGSGDKPATSITFTTTLPSEGNITAFSAKFGGFNGTAGNVTLLVDETSVGTGTLNATSDVIVKNSSEATGKTLTVTVTGISKGVKDYYISYTYTTSSGETPDPTPGPGDPETGTATLTFDNTSKRITFTTKQQVWTENGVTLTNDKASSSSDVADYCQPARFYKHSTINITHTSKKITQIVFDCNSDTYANDLSSAIGKDKVSQSSDKVTLEFENPQESFNVQLTAGQVQMDALTVTYQISDEPETPEPETPTPDDEYIPGKWKLVEDASKLQFGMEIIIASVAENSAIKTMGEQRNNNRGAVASVLDGENLKPAVGTTLITLEDCQSLSEDLFALKTKDGNLYAAGSNDNYLRSLNGINYHACWKITITDGEASIQATKSSNRNMMQYNKTSDLFSCYASASQEPITIYSKVYDVTATAANGSVSGTGTYYQGNSVTLTATADFDYEFVNWTVGDEVVSTDNPYKFQVTADVKLVANFQEIAATTEALSGKFSTGKYEYAEFATGNLQYKKEDENETWRFAKQQYQYVGEANINVGDPNYKGWIDMFGWSTSKTNYGVDPRNENVYYDGAFVDWSNLFPGEGWSTLSADQWKYLLNERGDGKKQIARVGSVVGIMLFPDVWNAPLTVTAEPDSYFEVDIHNYTLKQWAELEKAGALFLPAAGRRTGGYGNIINKDQEKETNSENLNGGHYKHQDNTNIYCYYWTSTINESTKDVSFLHNIQALGGNKYTIGTGTIWGEKGRYGQSVRLAKVTSTLVKIGDSGNTSVIEANNDKEVDVQVNRTFTADKLHTLCLPFDAPVNILGEGTKAYQLSGVRSLVDGTLTIDVTTCNTMYAGAPYLVIPAQNFDNGELIVDNVTMKNVDVTSVNNVVSNGEINVVFQGILDADGNQTNGTTHYYIGQDSYLYNGQVDILGLRSMFTITGLPAGMRARVAFGENSATGLDNITNGENTTIKVIENGQLIIIRNGEKYNIQGQKL